MSAPTCMCCNKRLAKRTGTIYFRPDKGSMGAKEDIRETVSTKGEAQRYTNHTIVSIRRNLDGFVISAGTWDGESWGLAGEGLFCTYSCASAYGIVMARRARLASAFPSVGSKSGSL